MIIVTIIIAGGVAIACRLYAESIQDDGKVVNIHTRADILNVYTGSRNNNIRILHKLCCHLTLTS